MQTHTAQSMLATMHLPPPPPEVAHAALRAIKMVALADGEFHELERGMIDAAQQHIIGTNFIIDELEPISPQELAAAIPVGEFRERVLRAMIMVALVDTVASKEEQSLIDSFAAELDVDNKPLVDLHRIVDGRLRLLRLDIARHSFMGTRIKAHIKDQGLRGLREVVKSLMGCESPKLAARYQELEHFPKDSLGRGYWEFITSRGFGLPGQPGGAPEPIAFHDCVHVLADYDTTPEEEVLVVSFQGGFQNYDPFFTMMFVMAQFHLGIQISPIAGVTKLALHPDGMAQAFMRGTKVTRDLSDGWDPWEDMPRSIEEVRAKYNILPREGH